MPTSRPNHLSWLCEQILFLKPKSILDVGVGFGSKGMLFREYTDIWNGNYFDFKTKIDGIEIFNKYILDLQRKIYSSIFIGDAFEIIDKLFVYDIIYCGDVIEHFSKDDGLKLLEKLKLHCRNLIIATPLKCHPQGSVFENEAETHKSQWYEGDFVGAKILTFNNILIVQYAL